jgi:hypothetical protein
MLGIMLGALLLILLGSLPAFLARYVFVKRPLSKKLAFGIVAPIWFALQWLFFFREQAAESPSQLVSCVAAISFVTLINPEELFSSSNQTGETSESSSSPPSDKSPGIAAGLSILFPGAGHIYIGRSDVGIGYIVAGVVSYFLFVAMGLLVAVISAVHAYKTARNAGSEMPLSSNHMSFSKMPLLEATISSPNGLRYKVRFEQKHPDMKSVEQIRMILGFAAKMLHIIDPNDANQTPVQRELLKSIRKLSRIELNNQTDVMAACDQPIGCTKGGAGSEDKTIVATLYFMNPMERFVNTSLPYSWFQYQFLHSWLALIQETLPKLDEAQIDRLQKSLERMSEMYFEEGMDYSSMQALGEVPNRSFAEAAVR